MRKGSATAVIPGIQVEHLHEILAIALEHSPHAIMLERGGIVVHANQAFANLVNASNADDLIGREFSAVACSHSCKNSGPECNEKTGKYYQHKCVELKLASEKMRIHLAFDVSERRRMEKELADTRKLQSFGFLVSGIAHDFNNVLTAITLHAGLLTSQLEKNTWSWRQADSIQSAAERGTALAGQLLSYLREQSPDPEEVNVDRSLRQMVSILRPLVGEHIEFSVNPHCGKTTVIMVPSQLQQIVMNLVINARDALQDGGRILLESQNCLLQESNPYSLAAGEYAQLTVADDGHGMDEPTKARIFEPFFSTKKPGKGTGLGLFTVQNIVRKSGGSLSVTSEPGLGTRFEILLPKAPAIRS
ncbi:MAG TPA: ATP-binding protein [Terriglobales bacterium]|nr:ATP-binding protein [Terriglobales bacterium]